MRGQIDAQRHVARIGNLHDRFAGVDGAPFPFAAIGIDRHAVARGIDPRFGHHVGGIGVFGLRQFIFSARDRYFARFLDSTEDGG